jgi:hypothetical protein
MQKFLAKPLTPQQLDKSIELKAQDKARAAKILKNLQSILDKQTIYVSRTSSVTRL